MSILSFLGLFGCKSNKPSYPQDKIATNDGGEITLTFFKHASLSIEVDGRYIYVDPVDSYADYARLPKADVVLVTHSHYDHFDRAAIDKLSTRETIVVCDKVSAEAFDFDCVVMTPGATANPIEGVAVEAVPARRGISIFTRNLVKIADILLRLEARAFTLRAIPRITRM